MLNQFQIARKYRELAHDRLLLFHFSIQFFSQVQRWFMFRCCISLLIIASMFRIPSKLSKTNRSFSFLILHHQGLCLMILYRFVFAHPSFINVIHFHTRPSSASDATHCFKPAILKYSHLHCQEIAAIHSLTQFSHRLSVVVVFICF